jgi:hypothetical protein
VTFFRQIGASARVAVVAALTSWRFADQVPTAVGFAEAVPLVFGLMVPLLALAFVPSLALPMHPFRLSRTST